LSAAATARAATLNTPRVKGVIEELLITGLHNLNA
jgi:hypothetical protein